MQKLNFLMIKSEQRIHDLKFSTVQEKRVTIVFKCEII